LQEFVDRWRYQASRAALAQSKLKILEKLPIIPPWPTDPPVSFTFPAVEKLNGPILNVEDVKISYSSGFSLKCSSFSIQLDSRIGLIGPNGAGKTTFLKILTGDMRPEAGHVFRHGRLRVAYFAQHHVDQLDMGLGAVDMLGIRFSGLGLGEEGIRRHLGAFGLSGSLAVQPVSTLSGGQKSRVVFAALSLQSPHILILDEPTNHLDMDAMDALISCIGAFQGGVLIVSHDSRFIDSTCRQLYLCNKGLVERWPGDIQSYIRSLTVNK